MTTSLIARRVRAGGAWHAPDVRCFLLLAVLTGVAHAADNPELQTIVITATRLPTPKLKVASSVTVITAADIAAEQERTLTDVLQDVPGLNVVQVGGPGGQTSLFIRGTNSNHTKVIRRRHRLGDPSNSTAAFDVGQLLTPDIERVEVLRGPQSGLYGADAIGGVINVITKSGSGPLKLSAGIEGGNFDTFNQAGSVSGQASDFHYAANIEHLHVGATPVTPLDRSSRPGGTADRRLLRQRDRLDETRPRRDERLQPVAGGALRDIHTCARPAATTSISGSRIPSRARATRRPYSGRATRLGLRTRSTASSTIRSGLPTRTTAP